MATFTDKKNRQWKVELDVLLIEDVKDTFGIELTNLNKDPMGQLRSDPLQLITVMFLLCEDQAKEQGIEQADFYKSAPLPPDEMIAALEAAIVGFFPSGQASHNREVLTKYQEMSDKANEMMRAKISAAVNSPDVAQKMSQMADQLYEKELSRIFQSLDAGTLKSPESESSTSSTTSMP